MIEDGFLQSGDVLVHDGEAALSTPVVLQYLHQNRIYPFVLPSTLHQVLNPCDNSFHSLFKLRYYRLIADFNTGSIDVKEKLNLAKQCYDDISEEVVAGMFRKCGLIESNVETNRQVVARLMCEGIYLDNFDKHRDCLLAFLKWCQANEFHELCPVKINFADL